MGDEQRTHLGIDAALCGQPEELGPGHCRVGLELSEAMRADERGLVHGGFLFGLADYAAMLAVNHPNVVLGEAEIRFLRPAVVGDQVVAEAVLKSEAGKKRLVEVDVYRRQEKICSVRLTCIVPQRHVLDPLL